MSHQTRREPLWGVQPDDTAAPARILLFHAPDSGGSKPVKATVPTYIKIPDTLFPDQSINHQFQSGE
jgi:hypothetical protein